MTRTDETVCIGLDNGYYNVKICAGREREIVIPSVVVRMDSDSKLDKRKYVPNYVDETGSYLVGEDAIAMGNTGRPNIDSTKYMTNEYRAHALYAMDKAGLRDVDIITGSSLQHFARNREGIVRTMMSWSGTYRNIKIRRVQVVPEPMGTYFDELLDWNGKVRNGVNQTMIGIVDVGGNTVDLMEVVKGKLTPKLIGLSEGMYRAYNDLYAQLQANPTFQGTFGSLYDMQELFEKKSVKIYGKDHSLEKQIREAKKKLLQSILAIIHETWGSAKRLERMILTGGAASYLYDDLKEVYPHLSTPEDPVLANARGFHKYLVSTQ